MSDFKFKISQPVLVENILPLKIISRCCKNSINFYLVENIGHHFREDQLTECSKKTYLTKWSDKPTMNDDDLLATRKPVSKSI